MNKWLSICLVIILLLMVYFFINNYVIWFFILLIFVPIIIVINYLQENGFPKLQKPKSTIKIKDFRKSNTDTFDSIIIKNPLIKKIQSYFIKSYSRDITSSGIAKSPTDAGLYGIKITFLILLLCLFSSIVIFLIIQHIVIFTILLIPLICFFYYKFSLKDIITKRKKEIEKELMFFIVFCDIMDYTQTGIYNVFEVIRKDKSNLFPFMKQEALYLHREIQVFGKSSLDSLLGLCKYHPSELFVNFIQGYLTSQSVGGRGTGDYLNEKVRDFQVISKQNINSYISTSEIIANIGSFGLVLLPLFIIIGGVMIDGDTLFMAVIFGLLFIPVTILFMIKKIENIQPFSSDSIKFRKEPIILAVVVLIITIILELEFWENIALSLITWSLSNFILMKHKLIKNNNLEKSIPSFIRDMNQTMLSTKSFFRSFEMIQKKESYSSEFNLLLKNIKSQITLGNEITNSMKNVKTNSWLTKNVLKLLSFSATSGTVTPQILEKLVEFSKFYLESKNEIAQKTVIPLMIGYMGSLTVVMMILIIPAFSFDDFTSIIDDTPKIEPDKILFSLNSGLLVISSFFSMMLISKIKFFTINHSLHTAIILIIITLIFYYEKFVGVNIQ